MIENEKEYFFEELWRNRRRKKTHRNNSKLVQLTNFLAKKILNFQKLRIIIPPVGIKEDDKLLSSTLKFYLIFLFSLLVLQSIFVFNLLFRTFAVCVSLAIGTWS